MRSALRSPALLAALALAACGAPADEEGSFARVATTFLAGSGVATAATPAAAETPPAPPAPPAPRAPRDLAPPIIRGIYVNAYAMATPAHRARLLALTDSTEINTWVVDVKDDDGIRYASALPLAQEVKHGSIPLKSLKAVVDTLTAHGIHPIARVVVFKDSRLALARPEWAIRTPSGGLWTDKVGNRWMSPWDERVWEHNIQIAEEAARAGFREIQFDYVRFPEAYRSLPRQVHAKARGERAEAIAAFLTEAKRRLHPLGVTVTADVFGLSMNEARDVGIGQQWETLSAVVDGLLPMVYPSHYFPTHLPGIRSPNRMPYETVFTSVGMGVLRNRRLQEAGHTPARVVPWIQAFSAPWVDRGYRYGPEQASAQMKGVYDLGLEDWIFWNAGSRYDAIEPALAPKTERRGAHFQGTPLLTRMVDRFDREGAAAVREQLTAADISIAP